ncbi:restriction endonuclease subunit S [Vibrio chemaguriensis]|uniref:Restriction endonuclease subunit S n=1 Tax=Vibrio chemaguriensis TaxID=2527672 RepID=A0ABX1I350_9VIBR|nr:restriction endonuclease subunit S [Vibrio chemaguriensis]NKJ70510.1 restriction endonuclease subunit S [Vibrio chemaguriensis]
MSFSWEMIPLGELITLQRGHDLPSSRRVEGNIPIMGSSGITGYHNEAKCVGEGVIVGRSGNSMGEISFINEAYWPLNTCLYVTDFKGNDPKYIYYLLKTVNFDQFNSGSAQKSLNRNAVYPFEVHATKDKKLQRKIGNALSQLENKVTLNFQTNQTLEEMAQAIFKSWFVDFDPVKAKMNGEQPEGMDFATASLFPEKLDSETGIPEGWRLSEIGDEVAVVGGGTPSKKNDDFWVDGHIHWTSPKDLSGVQDKVLLDTASKLTEAGLKKVSSGLLPVDTVLLSSRAPVGYLALAKVPLAVNQGYIAMKCEKQLPPEFVLQWCVHRMDEIKQRASGSTFAEISKKNFKPISVVVPSEDVLSAYQKLVKPLYDAITSNVRQSEQLSNLRDTLLPKLLSGDIELDVDNDDSPEVNVNFNVEDIDFFIKSMLKELKEEDNLGLIYEPLYLEPIVTWTENKDALPYSIVLKIEDALESLNRYIPRYYDDNGFSSEQDEIDENIQEFWGYGEPVCVREVTKYCMYMARKSYLQTMCSLLLSNTTPVTNNTLYALRISNLDVKLTGCDISNWFGDIRLVDAKAPYVTMKRDGESWILTFPEMGPRSDYSDCVKAGYESIRHIIANAFACSVSVVEI